MKHIAMFLVTAASILSEFSLVHAQTNDTSYRCERSTTVEPENGRCKPQPRPYLCEDQNAAVKRFCTANGCPRGSKQIEVNASPGHFCNGQDLICPRQDVVVGRVPGKCLVHTRLPPKGGKKENVTSTNPACAPGTGDASSCNWLCLKPPAGKKIDVASVQFLAREATSVCGDLAGYSPFDESACGTPQTVGRCSPFYYTWEARSVSETEVCGRVKNWSHILERCAAITFVPK
jgi:hypothetical protein